MAQNKFHSRINQTALVLLLVIGLAGAASAQDSGISVQMDCRYFTGEIVSHRPLEIRVDEFVTDSFTVETTVVETDKNGKRLKKVADITNFDFQAIGGIDEGFVQAAVKTRFQRVREVEVPDSSFITCPEKAHVHGNGRIDADLIDEGLDVEPYVLSYSVLSGLNRLGVLSDGGQLGQLFDNRFCSIMPTKIRIWAIGEGSRDNGSPVFEPVFLDEEDVYELVEGRQPFGSENVYLGCSCQPEIDGDQSEIGDNPSEIDGTQ